MLVSDTVIGFKLEHGEVEDDLSQPPSSKNLSVMYYDDTYLRVKHERIKKVFKYRGVGIIVV